MNLKQFIFWKKHRRDTFIKQLFEDVYIEDIQLKESIVDWITRLKNRNIPIDNFSSLFSKYEEIVFPIKVYGYPCRLLITDSNGNNYYLWYNQYFNAPEYSIGKMTNYFYTEFTYCLSMKSGILLHHFEILQLDEHGNDTDNKVTFNYNLDNPVTTLALHTKSGNTTLNLEISYESVDFAHDNKIWKDLLDLPAKSHDENTLLTSMKKILEFKTILTVTSSTKTDLSTN